MELRQLHYFAAICKEMHFSKAAENLCTTQSNLSQKMKFLENELGIPLFDRMGRRIALTEAGQILLEQSKIIFERVDYIPLFHEEFVLAVRPDHPAAKAKAIPFEQLQHMKLVMFGPEHQISKVITACCQQKGITIDSPIVTSTLSTLLSLVEQGVGACILPRLLVDNLHRDQITSVTLLNPTPSQDICILYHEDRFMGKAAKLFIEGLQSYIQRVMEQSNRSFG